MAAPPPEERPILGALAVVIHEGRALLAQRGRPPDPDHWGFPGGHVERGETALAAAARELLEETGVCATPVAYLTNVDVLRFAGDGAERAVTVHYLLAAVLCAYQSGTPVADDDIVAAEWVTLEEIAAGERDLHDGVQEVLESALLRLRRLARNDSDVSA